MDIQKEREAFEQWYLEHHRITHMPSIYCPADALYGGAYTNTLWTGWQAAKAQSDKKIKLLLCDEHLQKCESPTGIFNSQYPNEEPCLICLAKQAKAQAVPEGFVLVKVSDIAKLAIAVSRVDLMTYSEERPDSEKLAWQNVANKLEAMIEAQEQKG